MSGERGGGYQRTMINLLHSQYKIKGTNNEGGGNRVKTHALTSAS